MKLPLKFCFLCFFGLLFSRASGEEHNFQTNFQSVYGYLDKYGQELETVSNQILVCSCPRTGTNVVLSILNQLTGRDCLWARSQKWGGSSTK